MAVRVTMMLAWFDEPPDMLAKAVYSSAVIANRVIAADGGYDQVADRASESPPEQAQAIKDAAEMAGLEVRFLEPQYWRGQVAKRNALLTAATEDIQEGDWVMPLDADWVLHGIREEVEEELAKNRRTDQFRVRFHQTKNSKRVLARDAPHPWHVQYDGKTRLEPLLFKALYDMKLTTSHWDYSGCRQPGGERIGLSGGARTWKPGVSKDMGATFLIEHRVMFREDKQLKRNKEFCKLRDKEKKVTGVER